MTWIKICGITSKDALVAAITSGADAVGFVLADSSPRSLQVDQAAKLAARSTVPSYVVVVDELPHRAIELARRVGATGVQAHGTHATSTARIAVEEGFDVLRPIPVGTHGVIGHLADLDPRAYPLFDTATNEHGGSGRTFEWAQLASVDRPFVVAGGLGVDNVRALIAELGPFGIDASSRLESSPGVKDPDTIAAFIREARSL